MKVNFTALVLWTVSLYPALVAAATTCTPSVARMVSAQGTVEVRRAGQSQWQPTNINDTYCTGDRIQIGPRSRAEITLANQPVLRLDQDTTITFGGIREERTSLIELLRGTLFFFSRFPRNLEILTAFVNAGVEGTEGIVRVDGDRALISIFEGRVSASNAAGTLSLISGQSAVAEQGRAPALTVIARPRDAVQWALYYLPTLSFRPEDFQQPSIRESFDAYRRGDLQSAFERIRTVPDTVTDPRFFAYRASLLLAVGRADEANRDIDRALQLNPNFTDAFALQSIIAVVQNERERGLELGRKGVSSDPKSSAALVALSYAQQASFDLEGARASLQQAVQVNPNDALAWARLAEMWLSFGRLNEALEAARKAVSLDPDLSRTQTVLGFVYLTQVNTEEAKKAFTRAAELDQGDPLARLGFGLAEIRDGNLEEGRREIEVAVGLDPNNALMRSYLGKAYFEEKREKQAGDQYQAAKELDPKDPTPYFYDAILKQTTNRPVEALQDMEQAIELNDNRAVYRSRLLLDSDLAARSAALGRIYTDLGFQQLALVEGWKSVNTDPSNFSAHRFLADSYAVLPRHEIARVSELLQSQLLQPLNTTPIQPQLAESNLFLLGAQGPANLSFNEFNPLFTRNGLNFQSTGLAGENATYAGEGVLSGVYKKASFSLGGYHFQTNGWRINSDQKDTIADGFFQFELSPDTSVQTEVRQRETRVGDIQQRFFPEDFFPGQREKRDSVAARFGVRHSFSPDSILLGSFMFQDRGDLVRIASPDGVTQVKFPENSTGIEWQHLWRSTYVNLTSGFGYFDVNGKVRTTLTFPPFFESDEVTDQGLHHLNSYSYAYIKPINTLTLTAGISFDHLNGPKTSVPHGDVEQFNPKAGITWNPFPSTTIRATAFRVIKRTLITDQTLEPTQVAGFNQFFDDVDITNSWRYGAGIDQKFTKHLFGGVEASRRDLRIPLIDATVSPPALDQVNAKERMVRTYLFWTPHPWVALRTEYNFERFVNGGALGEDGKVNTHRVPVGVNFFHPDGLGVSITGTYYHQDGEFMRLGGGTPESGRDQFWLLDATINYRLPKRYGFVTIGATNLLDKKFKYFETDVNNPRIQPKRTAFFKVTLALP